MRYAQIRPLDITNGEGTGMALFVQGCHFHCKDCFNQETWDFNGGKEWTEEVEERFIKLAARPYIKRISFLGGEPLANENVETVLRIIQKLRELYPEKRIWLYTGYKIENIIKTLDTVSQQYSDMHSFMRREVLKNIDILCDGAFMTDKKDPLNKNVKWVGSTNQRVIDVQKSIYSESLYRHCLKEIVLYDK